jgi:hypothetical protein
MKKGEFYAGENRGKAAVGADCYYTHSVSYCDGQKGQALSDRAVSVQHKSTQLSRAEKKAQALAMDGGNDYDMDCFYQHEVSWCMALHAKQKAELKAKNFVKFARNRDSAYSSDPELAGLARMVHKTEPVSQLKEDERFSRAAREERQDRDEDARKAHQEIRRERETRKNSEESAGQARREERREAEEQRDREDAARGNDDSDELRKVEDEAKREKQVAKQELKQQLAAQQKEEAAEAELKAAKAQLHALASARRVSDHTTRATSRALPALHRLPVEPSLENAEPIQARPEQNVAVSRPRAGEDDARGDRSQRSEYAREGQEDRHRSYSLSIRMQEPGAYPLSVRKQEPKGFTKTAISWDKAHGVRPIDSLQQESKARSIELADWSRATSPELADFKVGSGIRDQASGERGEAAATGSVPGQLEQEALRDGLTLVPDDKSAAKSSSMAHRGLASDSRWEEKEGLRPVSASARRQVVAVSPFEGLHSQALLKREESQGDAWERRHQMIAFTSHRDEHSDGERQVLGDNEVPVEQAEGDAGKPAEGSQLVERAADEAKEIGAAGVKALGFDNSKDFEKHLEKEGV